MKRSVILINPPIYFSNGKPYALDVSVPPLGILYLASYINKYSARFSVSIIDVAVENASLSDIASRINKIKPFAIGISAMTAQLQGCIELARFLKSHTDNPKIFLGGPHISADPDFLNRFGDIFDYGIVGEAEKTFLGSLDNLLEGRDILRIQNAESIPDIDTIPFPDRRLVHRDKYSRYESIIFSRGCPYRCYYCSRPAVSSIVRYRSAKNMIEEIKYTYSSSKGKIDFQDDTFTLDRKKVVDFCKQVLSNNLKINWRCNTRIDLVDEELLELMKKSGCILIHFGIESGNERLRREVINKGDFSNEKIYDIFRICKKLRIKIAAYFMLGHPQETKRDLEETKAMILNSGIDILGLSIPTPFPGSSLYNIAEEKNIINKRIIDQFAQKEFGEGYSGNYPLLISENLSKEYIFNNMKYLNRRFYLNFRTLWNYLREDFASFKKIRHDAQDLFSLISKGISTRKPYLKPAG